MSDTSQGHGWWLASDGKWYPPEAWTGSPPQTGQAAYQSPAVYQTTQMAYAPGLPPYPAGAAIRQGRSGSRPVEPLGSPSPRLSVPVPGSFRFSSGCHVFSASSSGSSLEAESNDRRARWEGTALALAGIIVGFSLIGIFIILVVLVAIFGHGHTCVGNSVRSDCGVTLMKGLTYGVEPEPWTPPDEENHLLVGLSKVPMRFEERPEPHPTRDGWVMAKTRLTGICGSDAKQVFSDFGDDFTDSALNPYFSSPTVLGHEVVADVVELGPNVTHVKVGQRVVLNPWLTCVPRGISPVCGSCAAGDLSQCWHFTQGPIAPGIHTGTSKDAPGGFAEYFPAHESMLFPVPDSISDEAAVIADPFAVSLHSVTRNPPPPGGKVLVYGGGALGTTATAILRALHPDVDVMVVARFPAQAALARALGATVVDPYPLDQLLETAAAWSGGVLQKVAPRRTADGAPRWDRRGL